MVKPNYTSPDGRIRFYNCSYDELFQSGKTWMLAICDPPFGIHITKSGRLKKYNTKNIKWDDSIPDKKYFVDLFSVSKNQIIWGGNYFLNYLGATKCFLIYDKKQPQNISFASCEFAWTSFSSVAKTFYYSPMQMTDRLHSCQKPIALYKWLLKNYAEPNQTILDTHGGSMSHAIAVHEVNAALNMNLQLDICEIDTDYFNAAVKRFKNHISQTTIKF